MSASAPPPVHFLAGQPEAGRACPYCRSALAAGIDVVRCGTCDSVHHADCWSTNHGCAIVACAGGPGSAPAGPPAPESRAPGGAPLVISVAPERHLSWFTIAVLVLVLVLVIAGAAIVFAAAAPVTLLAIASEVPAC
jgi:hypothetical protein